MNKTQIALLVSIIANIVLLWVVFSPGNNVVTPVDTLAEHKKLQNDSIKVEIKALQDSITSLNEAVDSAEIVSKALPEVIYRTYAEIETLPDSVYSVAADSILSSYKPMFE